MDLDNDDGTDAESTPDKDEPLQDKRRRHFNGGIWDHFKDLSRGLAKCKHCHKVLSYKTTVTNLKKHLCTKHAEAVPYDSELATKNYLFASRANKYTPVTRHVRYRRKKKRSWKYPDADNTSPSNTRDTETTTVKFSSEIWRHFEQEDDEAKCTLCKETLPSNLDDMKNHLEEHHTSLMDEIIAKAQQDQNADSDDDVSGEENVYTEVLYLEDESGNKLNISPKKHKRKRPLESTAKNRVKRERRISVSSDEPLLKTKPPAQDELEVFLNYIRLLLQKIPKEASQKLHLDIINLIMNTQFNSQPQHNIYLENVNLNNASNANNLAPLEKKILYMQNGTSTHNGNTLNPQRVITVPFHHLMSQNTETVNSIMSTSSL